MTRLRRGVPAIVAILGFAVFALPAEAKGKRHHAAAVARPSTFPVYVDRGSDRNPGGDNLYFTDTKRPNYIVGPGWFQRWN